MARRSGRPLQAWLTDRSADWWDRLDRRHLRKTTVLEALTEHLIEDDSWVPDTVWTRARELDRQRHSSS